MSRLALVTGASGFIGHHVVERLRAEGWHVRALIRPTSRTARLQQLGAELIQAPLDDRAALEQAAAGVDAVFHLAGVTAARSEAAYRRVNAESTRALAEAAAGASSRLVYLSSYAACGPSNHRPRAIDDLPRPLTAYGRTKLEGEAAVRQTAPGGVIVRAPAVYGPGDRALLPFFRLVRFGVAPMPSGERRRLHLIYAPDLARALARAAGAPAGTYAVAEPVEHTWPAVIDAIAHAVGRRPFRLPLPGPLVRAAAAISEVAGRAAGAPPVFNREKALEVLAAAWVCDLGGPAALLPPGEATPLAEGLERTVEWYRREGWL